MNKIYIQKNIEFKQTLISILKNKNIEYIDLDEILNKKNYILKSDYIIIDDENKVNNFYCKIICWNKIVTEIYNYAFKKYIKSYEYNFLKNAINEAKNNNINSIIVGSSYSRKGIEEGLLKEKAINLSLPSQDLYYSCLIAKEIIKANKSVKNVYIGTGYYSFHHDLSKSSYGELKRIYSIYNPIFKDTHNCKEDNILIDNFKFYKFEEVFDLDKMDEVFMNIIYQSLESKYYNETVKREDTKINTNESSEWNTIIDNDKINYCKQRASQHNKLIKYEETYLENIAILDSFISFCNENNVIPILLLFPGSKYYNEYLDYRYEEKYMKALNEIKGTIHFLDFTKDNLYDESDFLDMDHLNLKGAIKTSDIINSIGFL